MVVTVKFFASLREIADTGTCQLTLAPGSTAVEIKPLLTAHYPGLDAWLPVTRLAVNLEYQSWDSPVHEGDELALIPPVSGG